MSKPRLCATPPLIAPRASRTRHSAAERIFQKMESAAKEKRGVDLDPSAEPQRAASEQPPGYCKSDVVIVVIVAVVVSIIMRTAALTLCISHASVTDPARLPR